METSSKQINPEVIKLIEKAKLEKSKSLSLAFENLLKIPEPIFELEYLEELDLQYNQIKVIPKDILKLNNLKKLHLKSNPLEDMVDISGLYLDSNQYLKFKSKLTNAHIFGLTFEKSFSEEIASELVHLMNLTFLDLGNNQLTTIPESITQLVNLTSLFLSNNQLKTIPESITKLTNLTFLNLFRNQLTTIQESITKLTNLTFLFLSNNQLTMIPESITKLTNLTFLYLSYNQLTMISESITKLTNLTSLSLGSNQLTTIPDSITKLTNLTSLDLGYNQLTTIPDSITKLTNLTSLDLGYNQLTMIPESISKLTNLTSLDLGNNQLTTIPEFLLKLNIPILLEKNYVSRGISFANNPLVDPPSFIVNRGREALEDYFRRKKLAEISPLNEIKVILVGKSEAGKTSLLKRICGKPFDKNESQTHGINIEHKDFQTPEKKLKLHIWDFGGQEIMHATHQFFLTKNSIYVLVLNSRQEEDTDYWLKYIETFGGNSPILVVMNKCDEHRGFDVDRRTWKEKYKGIKDFYKVSCATDEGIETFIHGLKEWILESHFMRVTWFKEWLSVRDELNDTTDDYINDKEYRKVCQKFKITEESEQTTLLNYMHDLGTFIHFDKVALNDTFVLNPNWVTNAVYSIINSKQLANSHGKLNFNKDLGAILDKVKYPPNTFSYIIEIMKEFELCFHIDTEPDFVLIPSLLNPNRPPYEFDTKYSLTFEFRYTFLPFSLFSRFMVRMNKDINVKWRFGVLLKNKDYDVEALVISDKEERKITIRVNGTRRREYFAILWNHFDTIHKSFPPSFEYSQYIPVPNHEEYTIDYMELIGREANGETRYYVAKLNKYFPIKDLLDGIEDPKTRMEKNKELYKQQDMTINVYGDYIEGDKGMGDTYNLNNKDGILNNVNIGRGKQKVEGDSTVNVNQEKEKPELQEVLKVLTELKEMLQKLNLPENQKTKAENALNEIEQDTKTETPDAESVEENIQKAVKIIDKSGLAVEHTTGFIEKVRDLTIKLGVAFPGLTNLINRIGEQFQ